MKKMVNSSIASKDIDRLDKVSEAIRGLMKRLQGVKNCSFDFIYVISSQEILSQKQGVKSYEEHALVWGKDRRGVFKLSYEVYLIEEERPLLQRGPARLIKKPIPLISTKVDTRLKIAEELPHFEQVFLEALNRVNAGCLFVVEESPISFNPLSFVNTRLWFSESVERSFPC